MRTFSSNLRPSRAMAVLGAVVLSLAVAAPAASAAALPRSTPSLCKHVTVAEVSKALGVKATKVTGTVNGNTTVCWYTVGANTHGVFVRTQTHDNTAGYNQDYKNAKTYGEHPKAISNYKPYPAFSTWLGSASYGYTYSVTVLKKSTELGIGAAKTTLAKVEGLTAKVLPTV